MTEQSSSWGLGTRRLLAANPIFAETVRVSGRNPRTKMTTNYQHAGGSAWVPPENCSSAVPWDVVVMRFRVSFGRTITWRHYGEKEILELFTREGMGRNFSECWGMVQFSGDQVSRTGGCVRAEERPSRTDKTLRGQRKTHQEARNENAGRQCVNKK